MEEEVGGDWKGLEQMTFWECWEAGRRGGTGRSDHFFQTLHDALFHFMARKLAARASLSFLMAAFSSVSGCGFKTILPSPPSPPRTCIIARY